MDRGDAVGVVRVSTEPQSAPLVEDLVTEAIRRGVDVTQVVQRRRAELLAALAARGVDVTVTADGIRLDLPRQGSGTGT